MNFPNLVNLTLNALPKQTVQWYQYLDSVTGIVGEDVSGFAAAVPVVGSFQPIAKNAYQAMGLDLERQYVSFYASKQIAVLARDIAGDEFIFAGNRYHVMSNTDWLNVNGWNQNMAVKISP